MSWRTSPLPKDWKTRIVPRIMARDEVRCRAILPDGTRCPNEATDVHHVRDADDHSDGNLVAACGWHHHKATSQQANAARKRVSTKRPPEKHPGLRE